MRRLVALLVVSLLALAAAGCGDLDNDGDKEGAHAPRKAAAGKARVPRQSSGLLPGMPPPLDPHDVYAADRVGQGLARPRAAPGRASMSPTAANTVDVIDPRTYRVVGHFRTGALPQHVDALLRPEDAVGRQRRGQQPHPDRPAHRQAGQAGAGGRPVQPLLHARRPLRDRGGRAPAAARLPRRRTRCSCTSSRAGAVHGRRPHGLHRRRPLRARQLRVRRPHDRGRRGAREASSATCRCARARCRRTSSSRPTAASSTSPT